MLGVEDANLKKAAVDIVLNIRMADGIGTLRVPVMHPFHCMQSRITNIVTLRRKQDVARRQLEASPIILREYISEMLAAGDHREATDTLEQLFEYLRSDPVGKTAHRIMRNDPAAILEYFAADERLDGRYREHTLGNMRQKLANRRTAWGKMKALIGAS